MIKHKALWQGGKTQRKARDNVEPKQKEVKEHILENGQRINVPSQKLTLKHSNPIS